MVNIFLYIRFIFKYCTKISLAPVSHFYGFLFGNEESDWNVMSWKNRLITHDIGYSWFNDWLISGKRYRKIFFWVYTMESPGNFYGFNCLYQEATWSIFIGKIIGMLWAGKCRLTNHKTCYPWFNVWLISCKGYWNIFFWVCTQESQYSIRWVLLLFTWRSTNTKML